MVMVMVMVLNSAYTGPLRYLNVFFGNDPRRPSLLRAPVSFVLSVSFGGIRPKHPQVFLARATLTGNPFNVVQPPLLCFRDSYIGIPF